MPSKIEWTQETWNPIVGCSVLSPGCTNCYAMKMAARLEAMGLPDYRGLTQQTKAGPVWTGKVRAANDIQLLRPLRWKAPRMIFVNSMSDLFHEDVPDEVIAKVFNIMAETPQHTYQVLTKRSDRMQKIMAGPKDHQLWSPKLWHGSVLPNVWLGVSAEDQRRANERIPDLLATPSAIRFVSAEPLLGPLDFRRLAMPADWPRCDCVGQEPTIDAFEATIMCEGCCEGPEAMTMGRIDWVIAGGESGPGARPMHPDWPRAVRDQCADADVPFFFKQWGEWESSLDRDRDDPDWRADYTNNYVDHGKSKWLNLSGGCGFHGERFHVMRKVGKKSAGRTLDGREHNDMPAVRHG